MSKALDRFVSAMIGLAALAVAVSVLYRTFVPVKSTRAQLTPVFQEDWKRAHEVGRRIYGDSSAPLQLIVMSDFQCPACASFHKGLMTYLSGRPPELQVIYVPYPLDYHEHARQAALIAECLAGPKLLQAWSDTLFHKQDSLGKKPLSAFIAQIGETDTTKVLECTRSKDTEARIDAGIKYGDLVGSRGTPTTLLNGWRSPVPVTSAELDRAVTNTKAGRTPFEAER